MSRPIAYLGPAGTFSHLVARKRFRSDSDLIPCQSFGAIFEFLAQNDGHRAVVPVENSAGGTIYDTVDLLIQNGGRIFVTEQIALDVRIALIGRKAVPVRKVFSHFVQLHNHREWLRTHLPEAQIEAASSTAVAAELAAKTNGGAALSAPGAAAIYGLDVLKCPVIRAGSNVTDFVVLARQPVSPRQPARARTAIAVSFSNQCGSLYRFLQPFAQARVNLNRIVSRPFPGDADRAVFFMEIDGAPGVAAYDMVIRRAQARSETFASFGSYPWGRRVRS